MSTARPRRHWDGGDLAAFCGWSPLSGARARRRGPRCSRRWVRRRVARWGPAARSARAEQAAQIVREVNTSRVPGQLSGPGSAFRSGQIW